MTVLAYLLVPILVVAAAAAFMAVRNREPSSVESGIDSFRREMDALSLDAAPGRRRTELGGDAPIRQARPTQRPPGPRRPDESR